MLNNTYQVYIATGAVDFRKSIDGLAILVQESFDLDPFSKNLFVFCNKNRDKVKILEWDENGFWLHYKRLEKGKFNWPSSNSKTITVTNREFRWILDGLELKQKNAIPIVDERIIV